MAWKNGSGDQYLAWIVAANRYWRSAGGAVSGSSWYLPTFEAEAGRCAQGGSGGGCRTRKTYMARGDW